MRGFLYNKDTACFFVEGKGWSSSEASIRHDYEWAVIVPTVISIDSSNKDISLRLIKDMSLELMPIPGEIEKIK